MGKLYADTHEEPTVESSGHRSSKFEIPDVGDVSDEDLLGDDVHV